MYARLHIWKQIEVFSFHWYYKTYKLENEFASVYPLMLFAEFDANKTCRVPRVRVGIKILTQQYWSICYIHFFCYNLQPSKQSLFVVEDELFSSEGKLVYEMEYYSHIPLQYASCCWGARWPWVWGCRPSPRTRMSRPGSRSCRRPRRGSRWPPQREALGSNKYLDIAARCYSDTNGREWRLIYL